MQVVQGEGFTQPVVFPWPLVCMSSNIHMIYPKVKQKAPPTLGPIQTVLECAEQEPHKNSGVKKNC